MTDVFSNNQTSEEDTIAAISTPLGLGGIGIVRISGPLSISIASKIFRYKRKNVIEPEKYISHKFYYGIIVVPEKEIVLDEVMMVVMRAPKTYTREDMVEINCHGGLFVLKKVLELIIGLGARLAEPGEFTKNAFLNGRVDLSQAEAVIDIINANCEQNLKSSLYQLSGGLKTKIRKLIENTIELNIKIEAPMDFPDQGIEIIEKKQIKISLQKILTKINELLDTVKYGQIIKEGINCLILGKANVGKSSLFNTLLKKNRAIVTSMPGTTRDVIEENITIDGMVFNLIDTAGMKNPENIVEKISLDKANKYMEYSQLFILMFDISRPMDMQDYLLIDKLKKYINRNTKVIIVENKIDLPRKMLSSEIYEKVELDTSVKISLKDKRGVKELLRQMTDSVLENINIPGGDVIINNERHQYYLIQARDRIADIISKMDSGLQEDFIAMDLQYIIGQLGRITGDSCDEEIINNIFSRFCIGK